jgi:hypothetical protein
MSSMEAAERESYEVPAEFLAEAGALVEVLRGSEGLSTRDAQLMKPDSHGFDPVVTPAVLFLSGLVLKKLSDKWIEEYLWPAIQTRIDKPSRKFADWLVTAVLGKSPSEGK